MELVMHSKWLFDAKVGDISPLYECGDNDHFMVLVLTAVHPQVIVHGMIHK